MALFGYDSQVWRTLKYLWIPGKLPAMYREGHRKSLVHPVRLFVLMFIVLALLLKFSSWQAQNGEQELNIQIGNIAQKLDTLQKLDEANGVNDSMVINALRSDSLELYHINGNLEVKPVRFPDNWIDDLSADAILDSLDVQDFIPRLVLEKQIKLIKDNQSFSSFLFGTMVWMLLILQPFLALWLFLPMYRHTYYSDHLILTIFTHASIFLFLLIWTGVFQVFEYPEENGLVNMITFIYFTGILAFTFSSIKRYYKLSTILSLIFWLYFSAMYALSFLIIFVLNLLISFLLF